MPSVSIRYLYHSGFAVKTASHLFIFDYYLDTPRGCGPDQGVVSPSMLQGRDVVVFVSHSHGDHYNPAIFQWRKGNPQIRYILADEIATKEDVLSVKAGKTYPLGGLEVRTLDSTDLGVAFLVKADGLCLYHAGDLNWWHWNDEPEEANRAMARRYQQQIDSLKGESIDIAFIPVDPRQEENALLGLDYFMKQVGARWIVPMHFGSNGSIFDRIGHDPRTASYRDRILQISHRGQRFQISIP